MASGFFKRDVINPPCGGICRLEKGGVLRQAVHGKGTIPLLIVGESPGDKESNVLLDSVLMEYGVQGQATCRKTNAVRCPTPDGREPTKEEYTSCSSHIWEEIEEHPPKVILLLGGIALKAFLGNRQSVRNISQFRGFPIPDQKAGCWVVPSFHPAYLLHAREGRNKRGKSIDRTPEDQIFEMDVRKALDLLKVPFPVQPEPIINPNDWTLKDGAEFALDYETTGLRPYREGHRIVTVGISEGNWCTALPMSLDFSRKWKLVLRADRFKKIAHNMKFEHQWALHYLGEETKNWVWDTMLAAHILDNRNHVTNLKLAAYLALGVENWEGGIKKEFDSDSEFNFLYGMKGTPSPALLKYNALDAYWTKRLADWQRTQFK